jgi:hypothetical protein
VVVLSRDPARAREALGQVTAHAWDPEGGPPPPDAFAGVDVVFHLAGENVGQRWTEARKRAIRESRVAGTRHLVAGIASTSARPRVLLSTSAVGYYGDRGDAVIDETTAPGDDFLARVCRDWEAESHAARPLGLRVVNPRVGIVLGRGGGALARMLGPFKLGLGGRLGSGRQWMPWIHQDDLTALLLHAAATADLDGPLNAVAPTPVTNAEFTRTLAALLGRPAFLPVPAFALQLMFGEFGRSLLDSQRVLPRVAERTGFRFEHAALEDALRAALGLTPRPRVEGPPPAPPQSAHP